MTTYFVMDSRASYDVDAACVQEVFEEDDELEALKYAQRAWGQMMSQLCVTNDEGMLEVLYDIDSGTRLK